MLYVTSYTCSFSSRKEEAGWQHALSQKLLSFAMEQEYGTSLSSIRIEKGKHGKPYFTNHPARFSLSHCKGAVCCALSRTEVGVDMEPLRPYDPRLAGRICTPRELAFLETAPHPDRELMILWTLKESLMKLSGKGIGHGFQNAEFLWESGGFRSAQPEINAVNLEPFPDLFLSACTSGELLGEVRIIAPATLS